MWETMKPVDFCICNICVQNVLLSIYCLNVRLNFINTMLILVAYREKETGVASIDYEDVRSLLFC
jgi:hypothetical protein